MRKFLLFSLLLTQTYLFAAAEEGSVVITHAQGGPTILRGSQTLPAKTGTACLQGDTIKTSGECTVDLTMNQMAGCRLLPSSECAIVNTAKSAMHLNVTDGNAIMNLDKLPAESAFQLETPTAIASVRGTQFWGRVNTQQTSNPVTTFAVRQGSVKIFAKSAGKNFTLAQGQALDIPKQGTEAPKIRSALEGEMKAMEQADAIQINP